jgi:hypothetical protein
MAGTGSKTGKVCVQIRDEVYIRAEVSSYLTGESRTAWIHRAIEELSAREWSKTHQQVFDAKNGAEKDPGKKAK